MPLERRKKLKFAAATSVAFAGIAAVVLSPIGETVASYADDSFGGGEFNAADAEWHIESSTDGTEWSQTDSDKPATLSVSDVPLVPGRAQYTPFSLRVRTGSPPSAGTVMMGTGEQQSGSTQAGSYQMRAVWQKEATCSVNSFKSAPTNSYLVGSSDSYGKMLTPPTGSFDLPAPPDYSSPGQARTVCFEFSLPDVPASDALNGTTVSARWTFTATQN